MRTMLHLRLLLLTVGIAVIATLAPGADLINTSFEDADGWANHVSGIWTQVATDGTWSANAYANAGDTYQGTRKIGFNLVGRFLSTPSKNSPGVLTFWVTKSGTTSVWTVDVEKQVGGGGWTNLTSFTAADITWNGTVVSSYKQYTVVVNDASSNVEFRWYMSARPTSTGSCYLDVVKLTEYVPPDDPDATVDPGSILYGPINQGGYLNVPVEITADPANSGNITINSPGFSITGPDAANFQSAGSPGWPKTLTPGTTDTLWLSYLPGSVNHADHYATATLLCNDPHPPIVLLNGKTYWDLPNIYQARSATPTSGTLRITGTVTATVATSGLTNSPDRFQFYIQDSSGLDGQSAILIDDPSNVLGYYFVIGQQCFNLIGTVAPYHNMLQFTPAPPGMVLGSTVAPPAPLVLTGAVTDFETIEAELVRINSADVAETGSWVANTNYALTAPGGLVISTIRVEEASQVVGDTIPGGTMDVIGVAVQYDADQQIEPRLHTDIINTRVADWALFR